MNYDATFYYALTPLAIALRWYAGSVLVAGFVWHMMRGSWRGVEAQSLRAAKSPFKDALLVFILYLFLYVPVPNPCQLVGWFEEDTDAAVQDTQWGVTTVGIMLFERLSYGVDSLVVGVLSWDGTVRAVQAQAPETVDGPGGSVQTVREASNVDILFNFITLRAQFVKKMALSFWYNRESPSPEQQKVMGDGDEAVGSWSILTMLSAEDRTEFLTKQITAFVLGLAGVLALLVATLVMIVVAYILFLVAGLFKFAAIFILGVFLLIFPFAFFFRGRKAFITAVNVCAMYVFLKGAVILTIWIGFFVLEGVVLESFSEVNVVDDVVSDFVENMGPGDLYTPAGQDTLMVREEQKSVTHELVNMAGHGAKAVNVFSKMIVSLIIVLLTTVYIVLKLPAIVSAILGVNSLSDDLVMSSLFIGGMAASGGKLFRGRSGGEVGNNTISGDSGSSNG